MKSATIAMSCVVSKATTELDLIPESSKLGKNHEISDSDAFL
jgi:hypothetical protein